MKEIAMAFPYLADGAFRMQVVRLILLLIGIH